MQQHHSGEPQDGELPGGIHLPDPSIWPALAGLGAVLFGAAMIYWTRDRSSDFSGPFLGAAGLILLAVVIGWAVEDTRMRRKAEGRIAEPPPSNPRYTQVMTFGVPEGQLERARSAGVLAAIQSSDSALHDLAGFQDLRIISSPARTGASQVIVETTWSDRETLASYQDTRRTMLDIVSAYPDDVTPGSVQVFDMEVVRDTKDVGFRFGLGAVATVLGAFIVGGFALGAGLTLFEESTPTAVQPGGGGGAGGGGNGGFNGTIVGKGSKFTETAITLPPNTDVTLTFDNQDTGIPHNINFFTSESADTSLATCKSGCETQDVATPIKPGPFKDTFTFTTPGPGKYLYHCDVHPDTMKGLLTVQEGAPLPGQAAAGASGGTAAPAGAITVIATDNKFDKTTLDAKAGQALTVNFQNQGKAKHNIQFFDKQGGKTLAEGAGSDSVFVDGGKSETLTFTPPGPGTFYYQCDLHPTEMHGTLNVT